LSTLSERLKRRARALVAGVALSAATLIVLPGVANTFVAEQRPRRTHVLLANEPRAYRESIAQVFRQLRPNVEVVTAEPHELEDQILRLAPEMVICSEATSFVREHVPVWVELYPGYGPRSVVGIGEERSTIEEIQLSDLLSIVDRAGRLAQ
jgi:hypothetical protein